MTQIQPEDSTEIARDLTLTKCAILTQQNVLCYLQCMPISVAQQVNALSEPQWLQGLTG